MVATWIKIILAVMVILALDLIIRGATQGEILIVDFILLLFQWIVAELALLIHAITHLDEAVTDFRDMIIGVISYLLYWGESLMDAVLFLIRFPFEFIGSVLEDFAGIGMGVGLDFDWLGGFLFDFRTLTFQVAVGDMEQFGAIEDTCGNNILELTLNNTVGLSVFGNQGFSYMKTVTGDNFAWYKTGIEAWSFIIDFDTEISAYFPNFLKIADCINKIRNNFFHVIYVGIF